METDNLSDLSWLDKIAKDSQIIGLGEATHGNKEFGETRSEISKHLMENQGYKGVILEFPYSKSVFFQEYINGNVPAPEKWESKFGYWTCSTEEVVDLINWIKENKKEFWGNDVDLDDNVRKKPTKFRDKILAEKTLQIAKNNKYILWSHNYHISKEKGFMGSFLDSFIGDKYFSIGSLFYEGSLTAFEYNSKEDQWLGLNKFSLKPAEEDSIEYMLHQNCEKDFFIDLKDESNQSLFHSEKYKARFLGGGFNPDYKGSLFSKINIKKMFDGLIFIHNVTPSKIV